MTVRNHTRHQLLFRSSLFIQKISVIVNLPPKSHTTGIFRFDFGWGNGGQYLKFLLLVDFRQPVMRR